MDRNSRCRVRGAGVSLGAMLWTTFVVLLIIWLLGLLLDAGSWIHALLFVMGTLFLYRLLVPRRAGGPPPDSGPLAAQFLGPVPVWDEVAADPEVSGRLVL